MASKAQTLDQILASASPAKAGATEAVAPEIAREASVKMAENDRKTAELYQQFKQEELKSVMLAPMYQAYFGETMTVTINTLSIYVPVNGRSYKIPKSYAAIVHERRRRVDDHLMRAQRMADVASNFEKEAGELILVPR